MKNKFYLVFLLLAAFLLIFVFPLVYGQTIQEITQSFMFNWIILFLIIFFVCWLILKDVFHSSQGVAIVISLVLGVGGSIGFLSNYGTFVPKLDVWVFLLLVGLVIFILKALIKPTSNTFLNLIFFVIPLVWFLFVKEKISYAIPSNMLTIIDAITGIFLVIAILMFILALVQSK